MAEAWPSTVPDSLQESGYSYEAQSGVIRTNMDTGPAKVRRRFTAVSKTHKGNIILTKTQLATWESWFENVIIFGTLTFTMTNPQTAASMTVRLVIPSSGKAYSVAPEAGSGNMILSIEVEVMP
jgi:hypothetical protein